MATAQNPNPGKSSTQGQSIYQVLKKDHETVKGLLNQLISLSDRETERRRFLVDQIRDELIPHSRAEEAVFYNSMRMLDVSKSMALHGFQEHMEAESYLRMLQVQDRMDTNWKETAYKLKEALEHHMEEEEGEIFHAAQSLFTEEEAVVMADAFEKMKPEIREEGLAMTTIEMIKNLMPPRLTMALSDISLPSFGSDKSKNGSSRHL